MLLALALALLAVGGSEAALRSFSARFSGNLKGNFVFVGNTLMTCPGAVAACPGARDATGGTLNNNSFDMTYVDADADAGTFDSSSGDLSLAAGSTIVFAGLYWGADTSAGTNGVAAPAAAQAGSVLLTPPGGSQTSVTASQLDTSGTRYQGFADVTSIVDSAGNGTYTLANAPEGRFLLKAYAPKSIYVSRIVALGPGETQTVNFGLPTRIVPNPTISRPSVSGTRLSMTVTGSNIDGNYTLAVNPKAGITVELHNAGNAPGRWSASSLTVLPGPWVFLGVDEQCNVSDFLTVEG